GPPCRYNGAAERRPGQTWRRALRRDAPSAGVLTPRRATIRFHDRELPPDRGPRMNEQIRITPIRLVGAGGEQLGIVPTSQAMEMAREAGMDLVEVASSERPPVCKILDYGKMKFE